MHWTPHGVMFSFLVNVCAFKGKNEELSTFPRGKNSDLRIPSPLRNAHFSMDSLSRVAWSSAITKAMRLKPPIVVKKLMIRGHPRYRLMIFLMASALSTSSRINARRRFNASGLTSAEMWICPFLSSLSTLFFAPRLVKPIVSPNSLNVVLPFF